MAPLSSSSRRVRSSRGDTMRRSARICGTGRASDRFSPGMWRHFITTSRRRRRARGSIVPFELRSLRRSLRRANFALVGPPASPPSSRMTAANGTGTSLGKVTPRDIVALKERGEPVAALTAYDYAMTRLLDECGIPLLLVGDSLGMVVLGYPDTTHVTLEEMEHHVRAAARAKPRALLAADLPIRSYESPESAVANARRL